MKPISYPARPINGGPFDQVLDSPLLITTAVVAYALKFEPNAEKKDTSIDIKRAASKIGDKN